jgi:hypothetical protein
MATLTAPGTSGLVELHFEVDSKASRPDRLVLHGRGVLDRRAFGMGKRTWIFGPEIQLELAVYAARVATPTSTESHVEDLHQQHIALRQLLAAQRTTQRHEQATPHGWPMTMVRRGAAAWVGSWSLLALTQWPSVTAEEPIPRGRRAS